MAYYNPEKDCVYETRVNKCIQIYIITLSITFYKYNFLIWDMFLYISCF